MIELYDGFLVIRAVPLRISDQEKSDQLELFSMEEMF